MDGLVWVRYVGKSVLRLPAIVVNRRLWPGDELQVGIDALRHLQHEHPGMFELVVDCPSRWGCHG